MNAPAIPIRWGYYLEGRYLGFNRVRATKHAQAVASRDRRTVLLARAIPFPEQTEVVPCHIVRPT